MAHNLKDHYRESVTHALSGFQLLEEGLKTYIDLYYGAVSELLEGRLFFGYQRADIQDAPLGRLLSVFSKVCANQELLLEMRGLAKHRDHAAHQAFVCLFGSGPGDQALVEMTDTNVKLGTQLSDLLPRLHKESTKVVDVLDKNQKKNTPPNHAA